MRSVIFMIRHDGEGAFGLTINRPTDRRFRDLVESIGGDSQPREDDLIYRGGRSKAHCWLSTTSQVSENHAGRLTPTANGYLPVNPFRMA